MDSWVGETTAGALDRMQAHAELVGLGNTDEATFRSFFLAALRSQLPTAEAQTEWHRFDLLVQHEGRNTLIEFKYFLFRQTFELDGRRGHRKGGAGGQNEREFWDCVRKLHTTAHSRIHGRYVVLVYESGPSTYLRKSFEDSYGRLAPNEFITEVDPIDREPLVCKVLGIRPQVA